MKLVDTSSWIEYLRERKSNVSERVEALVLADEAAWCDMTAVELWHGARGAREKKELAALEQEITVLSIDSGVWQKARLLAIRLREAGGTANKLAKIADHIAQSFHALLARFSAISGVTVTDRAAFVMGLYDGMMNEVRDAGQPLPSRHRTRKKPKAKTGPVAHSPDLHIHPYSVAVNLGKKILFSVPLEQITNEFDAILRKHLQARQT